MAESKSKGHQDYEVEPVHAKSFVAGTRWHLVRFGPAKVPCRTQLPYNQDISWGNCLVILLFGPPGCGKGTQGRLILEWLPEPIPAISTGDMLRAEIAAGTALGLETQSIIAAGGLVSDDLVNQILCARISRPDCKNGFLLDGYPRTVEQAEFLDHVLAERRMAGPIVIHLDVHADVLVGRMMSRRHCSQCGRMYNVLSMKPLTPGICDDDGALLVTRKDDQADVIRDRLKTYADITRPVLSHYPHDRYFQIPGERSTHYVFEEITEILERFLAEEALHPATPTAEAPEAVPVHAEPQRV